jgi:hypothetical protein
MLDTLIPTSTFNAETGKVQKQKHEARKGAGRNGLLSTTEGSHNPAPPKPDGYGRAEANPKEKNE